MTTFEKCCAVLTIPLGGLFLVLGAIGLFAGSSANFTLPPVLGVLPFFVGWSMCVSLIRCWRMSDRLKEQDAAAVSRNLFDQFYEFLVLHPDLSTKPDEEKWNAFQRWVEMRRGSLPSE